MSADQDFLQLCSDTVQVYSPIKKKFYGPKEVFDEYGLWPQNFINYKVLMGDASDNLPGVKGLGPKKLFKLFPELAKDKKVTLKEIIQKGHDKHEENGIYGNVWLFRGQLEINEQLMSLEEPNIPENDKIKLDKLLYEKPYNFNQQRFLQLYESDLLENKVSPNIGFWLSNNFTYITQYKHK
jgi:5'-3' exonuclease